MSPKGWGAVEAEAAAAAEARQRWAESNKPQLWLKEGESVIVRILEQGSDVNTFYVHEYRKQNNKFDTFTCLNTNDDGTPCPGCSAGMKRKLKGVFNVLQRNRPVLRKDSNGRAMKDSSQQFIIDGYQDEVVVWVCPSTTSELLRQKDAKYNGLMSRDVEIARTGTQFSPYNIEPAEIDGGMVPMSDTDRQLAQNKHDLDEFMKPPSFAEAAKIAGVAQAQAAAAPQGQQQAAPAPAAAEPGNPFLGATAPTQQPA